MQLRDFHTWQRRPGNSPMFLLLPNSPNLYPHFDAIYFYGLHLKIHAWGKEESKEVRKSTMETE